MIWGEGLEDCWIMFFFFFSDDWMDVVHACTYVMKKYQKPGVPTRLNGKNSIGVETNKKKVSMFLGVTIAMINLITLNSPAS